MGSGETGARARELPDPTFTVGMDRPPIPCRLQTAMNTRLPGTLVVHGTTAGTALPFAAIVGAMVVFYLTGRREPSAS